MSSVSHCKECGNFLGNKDSEFCSQSCAATWGNKNRELLEKECTICGDDFETHAGNAKFCSDKCADQTPSSNGYRNGTSPKNKWKKLKREIDRGICYNCGWDRATCDLAHVKARKNGGASAKHNLTVLCPNCHRLADKTDVIDIESIPTVAEKS